MIYVVRCGTPNSMTSYPTKRFDDRDSKGAQNNARNYARRWLRKSEKHLRRFDPDGLKRLQAAIDDVGMIGFGEWCNAGADNPLRFTTDIGVTKLCCEFWTER